MNLKEKEKPVIRILLVEDNPGDAKLIQTLLGELQSSTFDVEVSVVLDGEAALDYLFQRGMYEKSAVVDIVVLDLNLPKINGFEVLNEMRSEASLRNTPVFILTTSKAHDDIFKSYAAGAVSFITKPAQFADFQDVIKRFFSFELPRVLDDAKKRIEAKDE